MISPNAKQSFLEQYRAMLKSPSPATLGTTQSMLNDLKKYAPRTKEEKTAFAQLNVTEAQKEHFAALCASVGLEGIKKKLVAAGVPGAQQAFEEDEKNGTFFKLGMLVALHQDPGNFETFTPEPRKPIVLPVSKPSAPVVVPSPAGPTSTGPPPPETSTPFTVNVHYAEMLSLPRDVFEPVDNISSSIDDERFYNVYKHETDETRRLLRNRHFQAIKTLQEFKAKATEIFNTEPILGHLCSTSFNKVYGTTDIKDVTFGILCCACFFQWHKTVSDVMNTLGSLVREPGDTFEQAVNAFIEKAVQKLKKPPFTPDQSPVDKVKTVVPYLTVSQVNELLMPPTPTIAGKVRVHRHYATMLGLRKEQFDIYDDVLNLSSEMETCRKVFQHETPEVIDQLNRVDVHSLQESKTGIFAQFENESLSVNLQRMFDSIYAESFNDLTQGLLLCACYLQWSIMKRNFIKYFGTNTEEATRKLVAEVEASLGKKLSKSVTSPDVDLTWILTEICFDDFEKFLHENVALKAPFGSSEGSDY